MGYRDLYYTALNQRDVANSKIAELERKLSLAERDAANSWMHAQKNASSESGPALVWGKAGERPTKPGWYAVQDEREIAIGRAALFDGQLLFCGANQNGRHVGATVSRMDAGRWCRIWIPSEPTAERDQAEPAAEPRVQHAFGFDYCPMCGGALDTGWECNSCGFDAMPLVQSPAWNKPIGPASQSAPAATGWTKEVPADGIVCAALFHGKQKPFITNVASTFQNFSGQRPEWFLVLPPLPVEPSEPTAEQEQAESSVVKYVSHARGCMCPACDTIRRVALQPEPPSQWTQTPPADGVLCVAENPSGCWWVSDKATSAGKPSGCWFYPIPKRVSVEPCRAGGENGAKSSTLLICSECAKRFGVAYSTKEGGTIQSGGCRVCGKEKHLGEYRFCVIDPE